MVVSSALETAVQMADLKAALLAERTVLNSVASWVEKMAVLWAYWTVDCWVARWAAH